jgi:lipoteichoic acid synthase
VKICALFKSPYQDKNYFLILLILTLVKVIIFSMTIQAPDISGEGQLLNQIIFIISNTSILLLLLSFLFLLPQRIFQIIYGLLVYGSLSAFIIVNRVYNLFFHSYISIETIISYVSTQTNMHSQKALSMMDTLYNAMPFWDFLWLIDLPIILYISYKYGFSKYSEIKPKKPLVFFKTVAVNLLIILVIFHIHADPHYLKNVELKGKGLLTYYTYEAVSYLSGGKDERPDYNDIERIKRWFFKNTPRTHEIQHFGLARGKNLLVLQVEALQNNVINKTVNGVEITPNLNRIIGESIYFDNCYNQVEMATADAEALVNLSLYPLQDVCLYLTYPENTYNSLANQLKQEGYQTAVFHGFERNFYNREEAYPSMGFESYFSKEHFEQDEVHNLLLGDKTFLRQTAKRLGDLTAPYYAFIMTLTSHHPFTFLEGYDAIDVGSFEGTIVGDYIQSIHYTDAAIGQFYATLKREGILDETLMVLYGDHAAFNYNEKDQDALSEWFDADMQELLEQIKANQVPLIIRLPGEAEPKLISDNAGMIDIYPTVANLLGLESEYLMGRDLLNTEEGIVILKGGSFVKGDKIFSALNYEQYNFDSEITDVLTDDNELVQKVREARTIAQLIYQTNFFANK